MKKTIGIAIGLLIVLAGCAWLYQMHLKVKAGFVLEDHLEDTLVQIGEDKVTLRDSLYYIMLIENEHDEKAETYSGETRKSFWNIKTGEEGYISQVAKKVILEQLVKDEVLYREAIKNGWKIPEAEVKNAVIKVWAEMSQYQKDLTGYTKETLEKRMAKAYAGQAYGDVYGDNFKEVKDSYQVAVDEKLWESVEMGSVTLEKGEEQQK